MYAGHIGIALGAKGLRDSIPLWVLVLATQLPDWTDASLCLAGIRTSIPGMYSHSLPAVAGLMVISSLLYLAVYRDRVGAATVSIVVMTHMLGDYVTGHKPTWPGGPVVGLGMYGVPAVDFAIEALVIGAGWMIYRSSVTDSRRVSLPVNLLPAALIAFQLAAAIAFTISPGLRKC